MTGRPAKWTQQRKAALAIAAEWSIPGMDPDDVRQEALLALWIAAGKHDPARGPWPPFGRLAVKAHLRDLLQAATRQKRTAVVLELDADRDPSPVQLDLLAEQRDRLRDGLADAERLTATRGRWRENKRRQRQAA